MTDPTIKLSSGDDEVHLPGAGLPIGISATASTERGKGHSTVRFLLEGPDAMGAKPFDVLVSWYEDGTSLSLLIEDNTPVKDCSLRECRMDLSLRWNPLFGQDQGGVT